VFAPDKAGANTMARPDVHAGGGGEGQNRPSGQQQTESLFKDRYVDEKGQPLAFEAEYPHAKHPIGEFKMMPIRLSLVMDQRCLPMLLVECANSSMPIEVRRLRVLKDPITAFDPGTSTPGVTGGPGRDTGMPRRPTANPRTEAGAARPRTSDATQDSAGQVDVPVEVYAVIYIYNPPDRAKLGIPIPAPVVPAAGQPGNAAATQASPAKTAGK
jgi:hypothetical protein